MSDALRWASDTAGSALQRATRRTIRVGVTGLARAGKTAFLTSVAANLLAFGAGRPVLPALAQQLRGRRPTIILAPAGASPVPRFDHAAHLAALTADPPAWPDRTDAASLLALDLVIPRTGFGAALPPQRIRLELLDYPGEWLLDLPLLRMDFAAWSEQALRRLDGRREAADFLAFVAGLPRDAGVDEALAKAGHRLYRAALQRLRESGLAMLQPGRFLMPAPGPEPAWMGFFPHRGGGGLHGLLARRYAAYTEAVQRDLSDPLFGKLDRMVVLVDLLSALHAGPEAFADTRMALAEAAGALRWRRNLLETAAALGRLQAPPRVVSRVVFAATKSDHVGARQRGNLAALLRHVVEPVVPVRASTFAIAAVRCTGEDVIELDERAVSGVVGRVMGDARPVRSYPGEVPSEAPDAGFWRHRFLQLPNFEPLRPLEDGKGGVREIGLDALLVSLLEDVL
ncbi:MAG: YcjX family protein [Janthinobacterium lividum]